jgi:hypothetical protein
MEKYLGTFEVSGSKIRVSDPCYDRDVWCAGILENCAPGGWSASLLMSDEGTWGTRVKELIIRHQDWMSENPTEKSDVHAGVDSGQCGFWDDALYPDGERRYDAGEWYHTVSQLTFDEVNPRTRYGGVISFGALSQSGYGDGGYNVYVDRNSLGQIVAAKIDYIPDFDEEEEEEEND